MLRAWFALAVVAVLGLFYVGYGLQSGSPGVAFGQDVLARRGLDWKPVGHLPNQVVPAIRRTKIPGGWLVLVSPQSSALTDSGITFVPDPEHKWDGNSLP